MTLCEVPPDIGGTTTSAPPATWGWAIVEIRGDETWGVPVVVPAAGAADAVAAAGSVATRPVADLQELTPLIHAHLGSQHLADGELHRAVGVLARGARARGSSHARDDCLARLAHVEAILGDLRRASRHAGQVRGSATGVLSAGSAHARLARAWVALERTDVTEVRRHLDRVAPGGALDEDRWLRTSRLVVEAKALLLEGQPDAATRLLAAQDEPGSPADWHSELVDVVRARALLASGEPQRALAVVTPMPARTRAQAAVLAAAARRDIGDLKGAGAVLSTAVQDLERAPLALQIEAWLIEARLAEDRGKHDRALLLADRALRLATTEQMRGPVTADGRWLRNLVAGDPALLRSHGGFLTTCRVPDAAPAPRSTTHGGAAAPLVTPLTERESQVLELLAQMYSTEEIAATLYVSANTVKTHLKGIFGKLCVNRRVEAVRAARQLGLC